MALATPPPCASGYISFDSLQSTETSLPQSQSSPCQATYLSTRYRVLKPACPYGQSFTTDATYLSTRYRVLKLLVRWMSLLNCSSYISFDSLQSTETRRRHPRLTPAWRGYISFDSLQSTETSECRFLWTGAARLHIFRLATEYWNRKSAVDRVRARSATYLSTRYRVLKLNLL